MTKNRLFIILLVLALASMACSINFNLPVNNIKTGPTVEEDINISKPDTSGDIRLSLNFGAGELQLAPGSGDALVAGTVVYNVPQLKPHQQISGSQVTLETGDAQLNGFPNFNDEFKNTWDLQLGSSPMDLELNCGAYKGEFELGGLSLRSLKVSDGAADVNMSFSSLNLVEMDTLRYETGASSVELYGLANANFDSMVFKAGAGSYVLDFSGDLQRDATITIDAGLSSVRLVVPEGVSARVFVDSGLSNVDVSGDWEKSGDDYTLAGEGPRLTINVNLGAGNLTLANR